MHKRIEIHTLQKKAPLAGDNEGSYTKMQRTREGNSLIIFPCFSYTPFHYHLFIHQCRGRGSLLL